MRDLGRGMGRHPPTKGNTIEKQVGPEWVANPASDCYRDRNDANLKFCRQCGNKGLELHTRYTD